LIGSIHKKGSIFYVVLPTGRDPVTRRWKTKWIRVGPDRREAESQLANIKEKYEQGRYREDEKMTVEQYLQRWLADYAKAAVRRSTYESYEWSINKHLIPRIGSIQLQKIKPMQIQTMMTELSKTKLSTTSVRYIYNVLNIALNRAMKWQILTSNPCIAVEPPRKEKYQATAYDKEELQKLMNASRNTFLYLPIILAAGCGLRRGEVCGLRWQDILLDRKMLFVRHSLDRPEKKVLKLLPVKTANSERTVRLPELVANTLNEVVLRQDADKQRLAKLYADQDFVFAWDNGNPVDPDYLDKKFRELLADNDLKRLRFHDLRHTHATLLLLEHVSVKVVSERLGHSSTNITQDIYSHVLPEMQKEAADAIDRVFAETTASEKEPVKKPGTVINFAEWAEAKKKVPPCA